MLTSSHLCRLMCRVSEGGAVDVKDVGCDRLHVWLPCACCVLLLYCCCVRMWDGELWSSYVVTVSL